MTGADGEAFRGSTDVHLRLRTLRWPILRKLWNEAALDRGTLIFERILRFGVLFVTEVTDRPYSAAIFSYFKIKGRGRGAKKEKARNGRENGSEASLLSLPSPSLGGGCLVECYI